MKRSLKLFIAGLLERRIQRLLKRHPKVKLIAVGGSVGKTSTKLAIAAVLKQRYRVNHHEGNYNDNISVPLAILGLPVPPLYNPWAWYRTFRAADRRVKSKFDDDIILVELGSDRPGDLPHFLKYLEPDIGVVTATTPEHMENFGSEEAVIQEEFELARGSRMTVLNGDDEGIRAHLEELLQPNVTYGRSGSVHLAGQKIGKNGTIATQLVLDETKIAIKTQLIGEHSLYSLLAAAAVARELGLTGQEIAGAIAKIRPVPGRMNPLPGKNQSLIIDDSYNASPDAVIAALKALNKLAKGRAIAVLGSMNELGSYARTGHERVGAACGDLDLLVTIGRDARSFIVPAARAAGLNSDQIVSFDSPYAAGRYLQPLLRPGDTVLVKGSQNGVFSEEAAALLLADPADRSKLVRQTPEWQAKKKAQFDDYE